MRRNTAMVPRDCTPWPRVLAENRPFPEPTAVLITPDHYIFRLMYSRGVPMESLGIPTRDGTATARDVLALIQKVREQVKAGRGIELHTEVEVVGED